MLVLTRRMNESIQIGDDVVITIIEVSDDRVKIGIAAPKTMKIVRSELMEEVRSSNQEAISANMSFIKSLSDGNIK